MAILKTPAEIEVITEGGRRLAKVLAELSSMVEAGVKTKALDEASYQLIKDSGSEPAFLGYRPGGSRNAYPATLCVSVNETIVHGRPSDYVLKDGDVVKLDLGLKYQGFYVDSAITVGVGELNNLTRKLIAVTKKSLELAVETIRAGKTLGDLGWTIEKYVRENKFSVVKLLTGHGIGRSLHEEPNVPNFGAKGKGEKIEAGMVLAIEPMVSADPSRDGGKITLLKDDSFVIASGAISAHFEHTVAITENGPLVLTKL